MKYELLDVHRRGDAPHVTESRAVKPGDAVKLVFREGIHVERMWVQVTEKRETQEGAVFVGFLDNDPAFIRSIKAGDSLTFHPHHVLVIDAATAH